MFKTEEDRKSLDKITGMFNEADHIRFNISRLEAEANLKAWNQLWSLMQEKGMTSILQIEGENEEDTEQLRKKFIMWFESVESSLESQKMYTELIELERQALTLDWWSERTHSLNNEYRHFQARYSICECYLKMGYELVEEGERNADQAMIQQGGRNIINGISQYEDLFRSFDSIKPYAIFDYLGHLEKVNREKLKPALHAVYLDLKKKDAGEKTKIEWEILYNQDLPDILSFVFGYGTDEEIIYFVKSFRKYLSKGSDYKNVIKKCMDGVR